jgi:hypothetical protein
MGRACITHRAKWNACRILVRKPEGKKSLGRTNIGGIMILKLILKE